MLVLKGSPPTLKATAAPKSVLTASKALQRSAEVREVSRGDEDVLVLLLVLLLELLCCEDHIETLLTFLNSQTRS